MESFVDPETPRGVEWGGITMRTFSLLSQNGMVMIGLKLLWCLLIANRCDKSSLEDIPSCFYDSLTFRNLKGILSWGQNLEATIVSAIFKKLMQHSSDGPPPGDLASCYMSLWRCWGGGCFLPLLVMVVAQWWWTVHFSIGIFFHSSSFTCGLAGALASNPVDVVRTRMMNQRVLRDGTCSGYTGTLDCLLQVRVDVPLGRVMWSLHGLLASLLPSEEFSYHHEKNKG